MMFLAFSIRVTVPLFLRCCSQVESRQDKNLCFGESLPSRVILPAVVRLLLNGSLGRAMVAKLSVDLGLPGLRSNLQTCGGMRFLSRRLLI